MARPGRIGGATPIEAAIDAALQLELVRDRAASRRSTHPAAIAAQDRRRVARLAQTTRAAREAERRRAHRIALEAAIAAHRSGEDA